jgi:hypothetical protein
MAYYILFNQYGQIYKIADSDQEKDILSPFVYLGFEFNGQNILVKSANLSKFYRRMITSIKKKSHRALKISEMNKDSKPIIFRRQLYKIYKLQDLSSTEIKVRWKKIVPSNYGKFKILSGSKSKPLRSNYFSYLKRASEIMNEPKISNQVRNHNKIFNDAITKHLKTR